MNAWFSYFYGFAQADGHLCEQSRNRGRLTIEIIKQDDNLLILFSELLASIGVKSTLSYRHRKTNFGENDFVSLRVYAKEFRDLIKTYGFPAGKKDELITPPKNTAYHTIDYLRGYIDGNGSLGLTGAGFPFLSLTTKSECFKEYYLTYIDSVLNVVKRATRNKRDNIYNLVVYKEYAQELTTKLYYPDCLCLSRKAEKAKEVQAWVRPVEMKIKT